MKRLLIFFVVCLLIGCTESTDADIAEMNSVLVSQVSEWNKGNIDGYMEGYWNNDSLLFIGKNGPTYGYSNTTMRYKKAYPDKDAMGTLSFSGLAYKKMSDGGYEVTGSWSLMRKEDNPNGSFILIFRKIGGHWVIVSDHSS